MSGNALSDCELTRSINLQVLSHNFWCVQLCGKVTEKYMSESSFIANSAIVMYI